ncbi:MAG: hypothetical protein ACP5D6_09020 [Kosmotogaceae bacterium]
MIETQHEFIKLMDFLKERGEADGKKVVDNPNLSDEYKEGYFRGLQAMWRMMYPVTIYPALLDNGYADGFMVGLKKACEDLTLFYKENK